MQVLYEKAAKEALKELPPKVVIKIMTGMRRVAQDPLAKDNTVAKLIGHGPFRFRKRFGDLRVLYKVDFNEQTIHVWRIAHRKEAYR